MVMATKEVHLLRLFVYVFYKKLKFLFPLFVFVYIFRLVITESHDTAQLTNMAI